MAIFIFYSVIDQGYIGLSLASCHKDKIWDLRAEFGHIWDHSRALVPMGTKSQIWDLILSIAFTSLPNTYIEFSIVTPNLLVMSCLSPSLISALPLFLIAHWRLQDEVKTMYWTGWQISCNISSSFSWMRPGRKGVSWFLQLPCNAFWYTPEERHSNWVHTCGLISFSPLGSWYALRLQRCNDTCK